MFLRQKQNEKVKTLNSSCHIKCTMTNQCYQPFPKLMQSLKSLSSSAKSQKKSQNVDTVTLTHADGVDSSWIRPVLARPQVGDRSPQPKQFAGRGSCEQHAFVRQPLAFSVTSAGGGRGAAAAAGGSAGLGLAWATASWQAPLINTPAWHFHCFSVI